MLRKILLLSVCSLFVFSPFVKAQDCAPPKIVANAKSGNIFSPDQEMMLGEMTVQRMSGDIRLVKDEQLLIYINGIGERLIKHLPPTGLKFQFHIMDIPDANAFNIPGGHIFLSRKLIGFVNNEDELAGVMAHELGHATVHHGATDLSERLKKILNVTSLGDRRDITEKYNLLIENARTKRISQKGGHENAQQLEADKIGLFAMIAAGYDPAAFTAFFDRLTESDGKTGGWFSDFFGKTTPNQKRLREMTEATEQLPPACREGRAAKMSENFLKWQADVVSFRNTGRKEELPGLLWKKELVTKLRSDISNIVVSRDGRYILTEDDFSLTVIEREPLRVAFQIPVEDVDDVYFTPDDQFLVFTTKTLRFEKWNIAEKKPVEVREMVLRGDCWENKLSPDGKYLACVDTAAALNILDTRTGKRIWQKKEFYQLNYYEYISWIFSNKDDDQEKSFFRIQFTPDSRYAMFSRSNHFRYRFRVDGMNYGSTEDTALALDMATLKPIDIGGEMKNLTARSYAFLDSGRILGMPSVKPDDAGIFSFPNGKRMQKFTFYAKEIKTTGNSDYVILKPLANAKMGIFSLKNTSIVTGMNKEDATLWNNLFIFESVSGKIVIREIQGDSANRTITDKELASIEIPVAAIGNLSASQVSDNFNWLVLSSKTRGGMWSLGTGERKVFTRGFRGGVVADDGSGVTEFPKLDDMQHALALVNPVKDEVVPIRELSEKGAKQYGRFVLTRSSLKEAEKKQDKKSDKKDDLKSALSTAEFDDTDSTLRTAVRFELKDFIQDKVIWSRDFPKESPYYSFDEFSGRMILYWGLGTDAGKSKLKENPEMQAKAAALGNKASDYYIEVVDAFAGKTVGSLLLETGKGSFNVGSGLSEGDWLLLYDSQDRVLAYSIRTGELRHRFFGKNAAINPARNQIAVENFPGEVSIYNLETGEPQANYVINGNAAFVRFNLNGNKLFVLSATQTAYAFDLNKISNGSPNKQ